MKRRFEIWYVGGLWQVLANERNCTLGGVGSVMWPTFLKFGSHPISGTGEDIDSEFGMLVDRDNY